MFGSTAIPRDLKSPNIAGGSGTRRVIAVGVTHAGAVFGADVDGDGDVDGMSASQSDDTIAWYDDHEPLSLVHLLFL